MADFNNNGLLTVIYFTVSESGFELSKTFRPLCLKFHAQSKLGYIELLRSPCVSLQRHAKCEDQKSNMRSQWLLVTKMMELVMKIITMMMMISPTLQKKYEYHKSNMMWAAAS